MRRDAHLGDWRWWDADTACWRSPRGQWIALEIGFVLGSVRMAYVVLACAHLDHDPANSAAGNLAAFCRCCHIIDDASERRWWNVFGLREMPVRGSARVTWDLLGAR